MNSPQWELLLDKEVKNTLSFEAKFLSDDLKLFFKNNPESFDKLKSNYFRIIHFTYNLAICLKKGVSNPLKISILKMLHNELFVEVDGCSPGIFRESKIEKSYVVIDSPENSKKWMNFFEEYTNYTLGNLDIIRAISRIYVLFISLKPFYEGNIIIGNIYINFLLLALGYCNVCFKLLKTNEEKKTLSALKYAVVGIEEMLETDCDLNFSEKMTLIEKGNYLPIEEIIYESIKETMDYLIMTSSKDLNFFSVNAISKKLNITEAGVKKRIKSGKLIASKLNTNRWYIFPFNIFNTY
jgi:hypothetical protein